MVVQRSPGPVRRSPVISTAKRDRSLNDETSLNEGKKQLLYNTSNPFLTPSNPSPLQGTDTAVVHNLIDIGETPQLEPTVPLFAFPEGYQGFTDQAERVPVMTPVPTPVRPERPERPERPRPDQLNRTNNISLQATEIAVAPLGLGQPVSNSSLINKTTPLQEVQGEHTPRGSSLQDFVLEMKARLDQSHEETSRFMTFFSQELEKTNSNVMEWRDQTLHLRDVVSVQGQRIEKLEEEIRTLALSSKEPHALPAPSQEKLLYDINNMRHIPADYSNDVIPSGDQKMIMAECMKLLPHASLEGSDHREGHRRYVHSFGVAYGYGKTGTSHPPNPFPTFLEHIRVWLSDHLGEQLNQCSMTFYEPLAKMPRHGDSEASLVPGSKIAAVSLGRAAYMAWYRRGMNTELGRVLLNPGSLLVMRQEDQQEIEHAILAALQSGETELEYLGWRISLTFRRLKEKRNIKIKLLGDSNYVHYDHQGKNTQINFGSNKGQLGPVLPGDSTNIAHTGLLPNIGGLLDGYSDLVLGVGINNLKFPEHAGNAPEKVVSKIQGFCDAVLDLKEDLNIFIPEILPTRDPSLTPVIRRYNELLGSYVEARKGRVTLISTAVFQDNQTGLLDIKFGYQDDFLHLNEKGVRLLAGRLKHEIKSKYGLLIPPHLRDRRSNNNRGPR